MEWRSPTLGLGGPDLDSRLGLRFSRFRRFCMTTLLPCLHSHRALWVSFTIPGETGDTMTTCSPCRRVRLTAYRLFTLALRRLKILCPSGYQSPAVG